MTKSSKNTKVSHKQVRAMIKGSMASATEVKAANFTALAQTTSNTGNVNPVTQAIIQGIGNGQRTGNDIRLRDITIRINTTAVGVSGFTRYIIFQDHEATGATPATTDVLDSTSLIAGYNALNMYSRKRFKILADFTHAVAVNGEAVAHYEKRVTKMSSVVTFTGTTNVTGSNGKNAVFFLVIGTATNVFDSNFLVSYTDA